MEQLLIPKSFQLVGHTYKIKIVKKVDKEGSSGEVDISKKTIRLKAPSKDYTWEMVEETLFHEMVHAMFEEAGHVDLSENEPLVERMGKLLHQAIKTFKY